MRLAGKTAIVTGAREGIGKVIAVAFAREGAQVVACSRKIGPEDEVVRTIEGTGREVLALKCDVSSMSQVEQMVAAALDRFGKVDILVNNAGLIRPAMLHKMTEEQWDEVISVHLKGTFICTRAVASHFIERQSGTIINLTSSAGLVGTIGQVNYSAAKAGIVGFTKSAARELARYNVTVNALAPLVKTGMTETIATDSKLSEKYLARIPLGRFGEAEEVGPAAVFLASDEARYITGQVLCIDGGLVM